MAIKVRVHEIAKAVGVASKDVIDELAKRNVTVKNHMSVVEPSDLEGLSKTYPQEAIEKLMSGEAKAEQKAKTSTGTKSGVIRRRSGQKVVTAKSGGKDASTGGKKKASETVRIVRKASEEGGESVEIREKRISSTIIRRRSRTVQTPEPPPTTASEGASAAPEATVQVIAAAPSAAPVAPATPEVEAEAQAAPEVTATPTADSPVIVRKADPKRVAEIQASGRGTAARTGTAPEEAEDEAGAKTARKGVREETEVDPVARRGSKAGKVRKLKEKSFDMRDYMRLDDDDSIYMPRRKKKAAAREPQRTKITIAKAIKRIIKIEGGITVGDLAHRMQVKSAEVLKKLIAQGMMVTLNDLVDVETATLIASDYNYEIQDVSVDVKDLVETKEAEKPEDLKPRPPVVTVMGHVDHGKTSILDAIKKSSVVEGESGGITQHIGAYSVELDGKPITFIDTPGHHSFTAIRARGAKATDVVILVVAADEGVKPQTKEAVAHAKDAKVPIVVALNKMDKPEANPDRVKQELSSLELLPEDWGGDTMFVPVSAKTGKGLTELLEAVLLNAEVLELKANPSREALGVVLEAKLDKGRGPVATFLVQTGTLRVGDSVVSGPNFGRVKAMFNHLGKTIKEAGPSFAAEVLGLNGVPEAGEAFYSVESEEKARQAAEIAAQKVRDEAGKELARTRLEDLYAKIQSGLKELNVVIKGDVQGSVEAIRDSLERIDQEGVKVKVVHGGVGGITESDINLASASEAVVLGFNVRPVAAAKDLAAKTGVHMKFYSVIYELLDDVKQAMVGLLDPKFEDVQLGRVEVRETFKISRLGTIAGCFVLEGKISRNSSIRLIRDGVVLHDGALDSLKRFKDDVREVAANYECGLKLKDFDDLQVGDVVEVYEKRQVSVL